MSDWRTALLGAVIGGLLTAGTTWMQGQLARQKDASYERRQKLELLTENAAKLQYCMSQHAINPGTLSSCFKDGTTFRMFALSQLYFPELHGDVAALVSKTSEASSKLDLCHSKWKGLENVDNFAQCLGDVFDGPTGGEEMGRLMARVGEVAKTLW